MDNKTISIFEKFDGHFVCQLIPLKRICIHVSDVCVVCRAKPMRIHSINYYLYRSRFVSLFPSPYIFFTLRIVNITV